MIIYKSKTTPSSIWKCNYSHHEYLRPMYIGITGTKSTKVKWLKLLDVSVCTQKACMHWYFTVCTNQITNKYCSDISVRDFCCGIRDYSGRRCPNLTGRSMINQLYLCDEPAKYFICISSPSPAVFVPASRYICKGWQTTCSLCISYVRSWNQEYMEVNCIDWCFEEMSMYFITK